MTYDRDHDIIRGLLSIDDVSDHDAMGYDAAPRMTDVEKQLAGWAQGIMSHGYDVEMNGEKLAKKATYRYLMTERPFSIGCQPKSGFVSYEESELPKRDSGYYGIVTYDRELTTEEIQRYELVEHAGIKGLA